YVATIAATDAEQTPPYPVWKGVIPLPPFSLMATTGALTLENSLVVGDAWNQVIAHYLVPNAQLMDISGGCGRTARFLASHPYVRRYIGFDVVPDSIVWCNRVLVPKANGRFEFRHYNIHSVALRQVQPQRHAQAIGIPSSCRRSIDEPRLR